MKLLSISGLWTTLHVNANFQKVKLFLDYDLKATSFINDFDGFHLSTHKCVCLQAFAHSSTWSPTDSKSMEPMKSCHKEATNIAVWPQSPQEDMQSLSIEQEQVGKNYWPIYSQVLRLSDVYKRLHP